MKTKQNLISFSAFGLYPPGLVSYITNKVFDLGGNIVDVEENCRRGLFSIFLVIDFSASHNDIKEIITALEKIQAEKEIKIIIDHFDDQLANLPHQRENHLITIIGVDQPGIIVARLWHYH